MHYLDPLYQNNIGTTFLLKSDLEVTAYYEKIQLQLGEISVLLNRPELKDLLNIINSSKKNCRCDKCKDKVPFKLIKCDTAYAQFIFKTTKDNIDGLEELIQGTLFELEMEHILKANNIN